MPSSEHLVAEYAPSGRSTCKGCEKAISKGEPRLGICPPRPAYTKWHHLSCFPTRSLPIAAAMGDIKGFSSLKKHDQEVLENLAAGSSSDQCGKEAHERENDDTAALEGADTKKPRVEMGTEEYNRNAGKEKLLDGDSIVSLEGEVKTMYKDAKLLPNWKAFQTVIFLEQQGLRDVDRIAAFDFDGCLANTSVNRIGANAWSLMYASIPKKLQNLYSSGFKLVIFTNESNIERWKNKRQQAVDSKLGRLEGFIKLVNVPIQVFIACGLGQNDDPYRKPNPGMWKLLKDNFNSGIPIDMDQSFYVGDAAGRVKDHSDADIKFARAVGLKFHLPEEFFCDADGGEDPPAS